VSMVQDCKRALIWIKHNAPKYGNGDPTKVFVAGESAGGHLAALVASTPNFARFQPPECPNADTSLTGAIPLCGIYDFTSEFGMNKMYPHLLGYDVKTFSPFIEHVVVQDRAAINPQPFADASPLYHVNNPQTPPLCPFMVVHGTLDVLTSIRDARKFYLALKRRRREIEKSSEVKDVFVSLTHAHHAPGYFPSMRSLSLADAMYDFIVHYGGGGGGEGQARL
jgi:acetyl esterase/lipase